MKTYEMLAELFVRESTTTCFSLLGDANMNWATSLAARGVECVYVRDEHCAVAAAMSWARTSHAVGIATVTCGPGLTQILTALPAAVRANIPMVIFAGEAPLRKDWYNQGIDQRPFVEACGARYIQLAHSGDEQHAMALAVRDAFSYARQSSSPVVLGIPLDVQEDEGTEEIDFPQPSSEMLAEQAPLAPQTPDLARAAKLVEAAKKVVVVAGLGAIKADAASACRELAETVGGLLATTLPARGLFSDDPFYLGVSGGFSSMTARKFITQADLVVVVGASLASHCSDSGKLWQAGQVLHIDLEPRLHSHGLAAAKHHLKSDARLGVEQLLTTLKGRANANTIHNKDNQWRSRAVADEIATAPADNWQVEIEDNMLDPRDVVSSLDRCLPTDWHMVNSSGHCSYFAAQMFKRPAERFFTLREFGAIGNGLSFALGVAVADRARAVVLFDGDGSLLMHIQELETIVRSGLKILICVFNDGAYGSEIHKLRAEGLSDAGGMFGRPAFDAIAEGFGLRGRHVTDLAEVGAAISEFEAGNTAMVLDFHISDRVVSPVIRRSHGIE